MPKYQYACTACDHQFEAVQRFTDDPLTECPACQGRLRKVYSAVGVVFKGSGFYRNDSRAPASKGSSGDESSKSEATAGSSGSSAGGSDAKSDSGSKAGSDSKGGSDPKGGSDSKGGSDPKGGSGSAETAA
ncbi:MAG: FmdB family zinc ribbon protein [Carbonactinosporaceae bacterium]